MTVENDVRCLKKAFGFDPDKELAIVDDKVCSVDNEPQFVEDAAITEETEVKDEQ